MTLKSKAQKTTGQKIIYPKTAQIWTFEYDPEKIFSSVLQA